ncbi:MAG TPA: type II toxin-antitoxin system RelE/ParE family toxin [Candidatus Lumbricidophila sp.]|nr:type II toxin-antitoxin system RelE/ParE family toxin [Candidatus Lumbricidophila sp.]
MYELVYADSVERQMRKIDRQFHSQIAATIESIDLNNPRSSGKALAGTLNGLWRYRSGDFRIICEIQDQRLVVLVIKIGARRDIYR